MNKPLQTSSRLGVVEHSVVLPYWQLYYYTIWNITTFTLSPILSPNGYKL